jgi:ABC-type multidrug transport system fused ATPase/permease subunit
VSAAGGRASGYALSGSFTRKAWGVVLHALRTEPRRFSVSISSAALFGLFVVLFGSMLGAIVDDVVLPGVNGEPIGGPWGEITQKPRDAILLAGGAFLAIGVLNAVLVAVRRIAQGWAVAGVGASHRRVVADALASLPLGWHRSNPAGRMLSAMSSDSETATDPLHPLAFTLGSFVMMIAAGVSLVIIDPWIALAGMGVVPAILIINVIYERVITPRWDLGQSLRAQVSTIAHESFEGGTIVKALGAEDRETERFRVAAEGLRDADIRVGRTSAWFEPIMDLVVPLGSVLLMIVGAYRAQSGAVTVGGVVSAIYLITLLAVPIRGLGWVLGQMPQALVAFGRIGSIADAATEVDEPGHVEIAKAGAGTLAFDQADIGADDGEGVLKVLVRDVTLHLAPGSTTALVGATGSGKSTVAMAAARLSRPVRGTVALDGTDIATVASLAEHVALVPQASFVFGSTVRDNVTLGDAFSDDEVWSALRAASIHEIVEALGEGDASGLDAVLEEQGMNLSGGQRQRIAIARALVRMPRVLVLDDATSAVDPRVEQQILRALRTSNGGPTVLIIAYRLASILLADRVIHLDSGRVVDAGTHTELLDRDAGYRELVTAYEADTKRRADEETGWIG